MSVLVFIDIAQDGSIKKSTFEAVTYGAKLANQLGVMAIGIALKSTTEDLSSLGKYGIKKVLQADHAELGTFDAGNYAKAVAQAANDTGASVVIFSNTADGRAIAPRLSAALQAGLVTGVSSLPETDGDFVVTKGVFSGKAFAKVKIKTPIKIITLNTNAIKPEIVEGTAEVAKIDVAVEPSKIKVVSINKLTGEVPLAEAEIVVSGGRGLKGPENWGLLEDLAKTLNAGKACSRPVADAHWRPHNEHVGQTGGVIAPNLYIAVGISGAIQHLAGVNRSKVIVVINKDPEAPFFKAADYGIVGDLFEVVPKLTEAIKQLS